MLMTRFPQKYVWGARTTKTVALEHVGEELHTRTKSLGVNIIGVVQEPIFDHRPRVCVVFHAVRYSLLRLALY